MDAVSSATYGQSYYNQDFWNQLEMNSTKDTMSNIQKSQEQTQQQNKEINPTLKGE